MSFRDAFASSTPAPVGLALGCGPAARAIARIAWSCAACLLFVSLVPQRANAQAIGRPADERPQLPSFEQPEDAPILPPLPKPVQDAPPAVTGAGFFVRGYRIVGSTVFSPEQLAAAVEGFVGRTIYSEDLVAVVNALTLLYIEAGYESSGATLADQDPEDGIIEIRIIEGSLRRIEISGTRSFRDRYLRDRIALGAGVPLNLRGLEKQLQILQLDPRIERIDARLVPGDAPDEAVIHVEVREASRFRAGARFGNHEPPSIGALSGGLDGTFWNPTGWGDRLHADFTVSEGLRRAQAGYEIPINRWDTTFSLDARYSSAEVVESGFDQLDIESRFQSYQLSLRHPVLQSPSTRIEFGLIGDWRQSVTKLLGSKNSFAGCGEEDGTSTASVLRLTADWLQRDLSQVFAVRSQLSYGLAWLGATTCSGADPNAEGGDEPDARFVSWLAQLQWARRFDDLGFQLILRADLQLASDPLLTLEQFAIGGFGSVRGYRQNQIVRDQGFVTSAELRIPLFGDVRRGLRVEIAPFVDFGRSWDHKERDDDGHKDLVAIGIGTRFSLTRYVDAQLYWAGNLTSTRTSGDLQDSGVQFLITGRFP